jgi:hypothetical protein
MFPSLLWLPGSSQPDKSCGHQDFMPHLLDADLPWASFTIFCKIYPLCHVFRYFILKFCFSDHLGELGRLWNQEKKLRSHGQQDLNLTLTGMFISAEDTRPLSWAPLPVPSKEVPRTPCPCASASKTSDTGWPWLLAHWMPDSFINITGLRPAHRQAHRHQEEWIHHKGHMAALPQTGCPGGTCPTLEHLWTVTTQKSIGLQEASGLRL